MKKRTKIAIIVISVVLFLALMAFLCVYFLFLHHYKGTDRNAPFDPNAPFDITTVKTVEKQESKDFVILNLADVQLCDIEPLSRFSTMKKEIRYLVENTHPDLITLTGDQTWSNENLISLTRLVRFLDSLKIPYAPVFGNHDYGNDKDSAVLSQKACCDVYEKGKYCLFDRGPSDIGTLGNYVVNVVEGDKIVKTLYFIDSGYEEKITDRQIEWFRWNAEGIRAANGGEYVEGMCFMHKPLPEYADAYYAYRRGDATAEGMVEHHYSLRGSEQNGFFDAAKACGVTDVVCGHQHGNCFSITYEGVRLTFALKTGELGGTADDAYLNGGTYFTLDGTSTSVNHLFVTEDQFPME